MQKNKKETEMSISNYPSVVTLPEFTTGHLPLVIDFLSIRFPQISKDVWRKRIEQGKVLDGDKKPITLESCSLPHSKIYYFREVVSEPVIPFKESIIFQNSHLLVADKPHFLPVTPGGSYVNHTLLNRLKTTTGISDLVPVHRIDRETAGVVLFSVEKSSRGIYQKLFMDGKIRKTYMALTHWPAERKGEVLWPVTSRNFLVKRVRDIIKSGNLLTKNGQLIIENRVVKGDPWFRMRIDEDGAVNSTTRVEILDVKGDAALLRLFPETGKKHQLRLHLSSVGCPIINDHFYPELLPDSLQDFDHPLQLLAHRLEFTDPISGAPMDFLSSFTLQQDYYIAQAETEDDGNVSRTVVPSPLTD